MTMYKGFLESKQWDLIEQHMTWPQKTYIYFATPTEITDLGNNH